jgi:hypothetical protein
MDNIHRSNAQLARKPKVCAGEKPARRGLSIDSEKRGYFEICAYTNAVFFESPR